MFSYPVVVTVLLTTLLIPSNVIASDHHVVQNHVLQDTEADASISRPRSLKGSSSSSKSSSSKGKGGSSANTGSKPDDSATVGATGLSFDTSDTALLVIDPQNDFLSPDGVTWGIVGDSVTEHNTVNNLLTLFQTAKAEGYVVAVSPHWYFPTDLEWEFEGTVEKVMHDIKMFQRMGPLNLDGFEGSGADWLPVLKPYIEDGKTIIMNPHKVYGPETNDTVLQLRKRKIDRVILAGMSANLCVESHMRELVEQGFDVTVVSDGTAGAITPDLGDGYMSALINFRFIANAVVTTEEAVAAMTS